MSTTAGRVRYAMAEQPEEVNLKCHTVSALECHQNGNFFADTTGDFRGSVDAAPQGFEYGTHSTHGGLHEGADLVGELLLIPR